MLEIFATNDHYSGVLGKIEEKIFIRKIESTGKYFIVGERHYRNSGQDFNLCLDSDIKDFFFGHFLPINYYRSLLLTHCKGFQYSSFKEVFFHSEEDANAAIKFFYTDEAYEFLEALLLADKLANPDRNIFIKKPFTNPPY